MRPLFEALAQGGTAIRSRCSDRNAKASNGWSTHSHRGNGPRGRWRGLGRCSPSSGGARGGAVRGGNQRAAGLPALHRLGRRDPGDGGAPRGARCLPARRRAASTMPSSTTLLSHRRKLQRSYPSGDLEQARAIRACLLAGRSDLSAATHCRRTRAFRRAHQMRVSARPDSGVGRAPCPRLARRFLTRRVVFGQSMA